MTRRQRLQKIFKGEIPDRPAIKLWGARPRKKLLHPKYRPVLKLALEKTDIVADNDYSFDPYWGANPPQSHIEERYTDEGKWVDVITACKTPDGDLRKIRRNSTEGKPGYELEFLIKEPADLKKLLSVKYTPSPVDIALYNRVDQEVGEKGIALYCLKYGHSPYSLLRLIGSENFSLWMYEIREELLEIIAIFRDRTLEHVKAALQAGIRYFGWGGPELFVPPLMSPDFFRELVLPFDKSIIDAIHNGGGYVWVHSHGKMKDVLPLFVEMGVDVLNPLEKPPMGDVSLEEAFSIVGDNMALEGNIPEDDLYRLTPSQIRQLTTEALEIGKDKPFILCHANYFDADPFPSDRFIENLLVFINTAFDEVNK